MKPSFLAFSDELLKIANIRAQAATAARDAGKSFMGEFWQGGKLNKAMTLLGAAGAVGEALPQHDPRQQDRGRAERLMAAPGSIVGGTVGAAMGSRMFGGGFKGLLGSMIMGTAGGLYGEKVTSAPWRQARINRQIAMRQAQMQQGQPYPPAGMMPGNGVIA